MMQVEAVLFDTFGSVVDWRSSLIADFTRWGGARGIAADWAGLVDAWRAGYAPSMDRVRRGEQPWTLLDDLHRATLDGLVDRFGLAHLDDADRDHLNRGWHRLVPWPDAIPGLTRLRRRCIVGPLSNANLALLVNMARHAAIPWDVVFGSELFGHYKPDPQTYLGACTLLRLPPERVMMAAAHNHDLHAARACGLRTAFFPRPTEYGPLQKRDFAADSDWDIVAADIMDLAARLGA